MNKDRGIDKVRERGIDKVRERGIDKKRARDFFSIWFWYIT